MADSRFIPYLETVPTLGAEVFVADTARVVGDVHLGPGTSVWYGAVIRGDVHQIRIGARVNVQDMTMIHVTSGRFSTTIGDDVTIGHRVILHGCTIEDRALIGMGAIVLDGAHIGHDAFVGAGAVVTPGTVVPPKTLVLGSPARAKRPLSAEELAGQVASATHYAELAGRYMAAGYGRTEVSS